MDVHKNRNHIYIIAEAGVNHNGDIELAKRLVDMAKEAGADAVKFQTFKAEESTGMFAGKADYQKRNTQEEESQFDMIKKLELPFQAFDIIQEYCREKGIDFISTPDGEESLQYLLHLNVPVIKIGSTEVTNYPFLEQIGKTGKPLILSTGMSTLGEVEKAVDILQGTGNRDITLLHCTTDYPTEIGQVNMRAMLTLKKAFQLEVGYSDHTIGFEAAVTAAAFGAVCIEKHITLDRAMPGPDHKASMPPGEFREYVTHIRNTELLLGDGRKHPTEKERYNMAQVRRSIIIKEKQAAGTVITRDMLCLKRPGTGINPEFVDVLVGRTLKRDLEKEEAIRWEDV